MAEEKRRNLGRGLSALLGDSGVVAAATVLENNAVVALPATINAAALPLRGLRTLSITQLQPGKFQPRRQFDEDAIADLVESVREKGILQPILVRPLTDDTFEIIAGERRWRAAQRAQLHEVPAIIRELSDKDALEVALVENLQRQDLSALEEAEGYRRLIDEFDHTQEELAKAVGKSRSHVANMMRLLGLPEPVRLMLDRKELSPGHARALLTAADPVRLAQQVVSKNLNVRQTEKLAANADLPPKGKKTATASAVSKDTDTAALERDLADMLGLKVSITSTGRGGELTLYYGSLEQLDDILSRLSSKPVV